MTANAPSDARIRIMIIDIELDILFRLNVLLESRGHYIKTFDKPAQALEYLASEHGQYDLVITN